MRPPVKTSKRRRRQIAFLGVTDDADGSTAEAITLSDVRIAWSTGDGLALPTMRVNPAAIAAGWLGSTATPFKGSKDSGAFFGVAVRWICDGGPRAETRLGSLILVGTVTLGVILWVRAVVLVLYRDVFIGSLAQLRLDAFFLGRSGF